MINRWLTKIIDLLFFHRKDFALDERRFWDNHWEKMIKLL
ncbi:MAG: hypothetical protein KatS3mg094_092 [Candidatus Parcubacteria bacterium]|nr:MAG: hypothetical protein KatS3mg094_092 [Candidatus Parcubacteria bacterium]